MIYSKSHFLSALRTLSDPIKNFASVLLKLLHLSPQVIIFDLNWLSMIQKGVFIKPHQNVCLNLTQMPSAFTTSYHFWLKLTFNDTNMHFEVLKTHRVDFVESEQISFSENLTFDLHWVPHQTPSKFLYQCYPNALSFHHKLSFLT